MWRVLVGALMVFSGCVFVAQFDPESQPCELNAEPGLQCADGYHCEVTGSDAGVCKKGDDQPPVDAGSDAGVSVDAGVMDAGSMDAGAVDAGP